MHMPTNKPDPKGVTISRRRFLIGAAGLTGAAALSACVAPPAPAAAPSAPDGAPASVPEATSVPVAEITAYPRTVKDMAGRELVLQRPPERVALMTYRYILDEMLLLDTEPIAYAKWVEDVLPAWTQEALDKRGLKPIDINAKGYPAEPNLELLATLKPDLIVTLAEKGKAENVKNLALLEQIAPVVVMDWALRDYQRLSILSEIFARESKVNEIKARDDALFASITRPPEGIELVVGYPYVDGGPKIDISNARALPVLVRAGFQLKDFGRPETEDGFQVVEEKFDLLEAGMLWSAAPIPETSGAEAFEASKILKQLKVVQEGRYRRLDVNEAIAVLDWTPLATPFLVKTLNELVASYNFEGTSAPAAAVATFPRTITDGAGQQVTIPAKPERIAVLDPLWSLEGLLSLGVAPVLVGQRSFVQNFNGGDPLKHWPWLEDALTKLGAQPTRISADKTNIEAVAQANPDLIIGMPNWVDESRDLLQGIAPTVTIPLKGGVGAAITLLGQVLGMEAEAAKVIADWNERIKTEVEGLVPPGKTAAIIRTDGEGTFTVFNTPGYGPYDMFTQMGFGVPETLATVPKNEYGLGSDFSLEKLDVLDPADVIIVLGFSVDATDELLKNPLFTRIPAVKSGRVLRIAQGPIAQGLAAQSPLNLNALLAEVKKAAEFVR
jgi:ABC-type Fe3+-hydroxamate transport system substrate-binding protein